MGYLKIIFPTLLAAFGGTISLIAPQGLSAQEAIERISSYVDLLETGEVKVSEVIEISGQGDDFKFGIARELPRSISTPTGSAKTLEYKIDRCMLNEVFVRCAVVTMGEDLFARLGDPDVLLPKTATMRIFEYDLLIKGAVSQFADHKSFTWNFSKDEFAVPIKSMELFFRSFSSNSLIQPIKKSRAWIENKGKTQQDLKFNLSAENTLQLKYHHELAVGNHLIVAIEW